MLHATRVSLGLAVSAVAVAAIVGSLIGLIAGYLGARMDLVLMFCMDILLAFPGTLLAIAIVAMMGPGLRELAVRHQPGSDPVLRAAQPGGRALRCASRSS